MAVNTHKKAHGHRSSARGTAIASAVIVVVLVAGGCALLATKHPGAAAGTGPKIRTASATKKTGKPKPAAPIRVVSISPKPGAQGVVFSPVIVVHFSAPPALSGAKPKLSPSPPGSWAVGTSNTLVFRPSGNFVPFSSVTLTLPGGSHGLRSAAGAVLPDTVKSKFTIRAGSELRLQQLLAELGYLPVRFIPGATTSAYVTGNPVQLTSDLTAEPRHHGSNTTSTSTTTTTTRPSTTTTTTRPASTTTSTSTSTSTTAPTTTTQPAPPTTMHPPSVGAPGYGTYLIGAPGPGATTVEEPGTASDIPLSPLPGRFAWRFKNTPPTLAALWVPGEANVVTIGAVMQFELDHGLATDGAAGPSVWTALLKAVAARDVTTAPYDYVFVDTGSPEYLSLWRDGVVIFTTLVNTGIPQAATELGTWPVYVRYTVTTMSGTEPDGQTYSDPGIPWVSYFHGGDALHGYLRAQYGFPQSLGCVEMPYSSAQTVFPFTPIGTLVTVF